MRVADSLSPMPYRFAGIHPERVGRSGRQQLEFGTRARRAGRGRVVFGRQ